MVSFRMLFFTLNQWAPWKIYCLNDHLTCNPNTYLLTTTVLFISLWNLTYIKNHIRNISLRHPALFSGFFLYKRELNYPILKEYQHMSQLQKQAPRSVKKVFLEVSKNHLCQSFFLNKFLRRPFLTEHLRWLLLQLVLQIQKS